MLLNKALYLKLSYIFCYIDVRYYIERTSGTKATILVDRKNSVVKELRDDSKTTFDEAIGFSTYSDKYHPNSCQIRSAVRIFYAISCRLVQNTLISLDYSI